MGARGHRASGRANGEYELGGKAKGGSNAVGPGEASKRGTGLITICERTMVGECGRGVASVGGGKQRKTTNRHQLLTKRSHTNVA